MPTYKLRPQAYSDLQSIRKFIAKDNPERACTFVLELTEHFQKIADSYIRHRVIKSLGPDIRRAVHGKYNIYYRFIGDDGRDVLIIRVLQARRDLSRIVMD